MNSSPWGVPLRLSHPPGVRERARLPLDTPPWLPGREGPVRGGI